MEWLTANWRTLLHEDDRYPWPDSSGEPAAMACNSALDQWATANDPQGSEHYESAQDWYFRHGLRSAAAGGLFPDLFIRRVADDIELSWSGTPPEFTPDGFAFESGPGHARLPVGDVAETLRKTLEWATSCPPRSPVQYHDQIATLRTKVTALCGVESSV